MATEAWVKREDERQQLIKEIQTWLYDYDEEGKWQEFCSRLANIIILYLFERQIKNIFEEVITNVDPECQRIFDSILPKFEQFARAEEEKNALLADLAKWLTESALHKFAAALTSKEIADPQTIFHASGAMATVSDD